MTRRQTPLWRHPEKRPTHQRVTSGGTSLSRSVVCILVTSAASPIPDNSQAVPYNDLFPAMNRGRPHSTGCASDRNGISHAGAARLPMSAHHDSPFSWGDENVVLLAICEVSEGCDRRPAAKKHRLLRVFVACHLHRTQPIVTKAPSVLAGCRPHSFSTTTPPR